MFFCFSQSILIISDILTKIYKITIACFKPTISVGSTLAHARYYLDDPVHVLVSCAEFQKCDCNFVHHLPDLFPAPVPKFTASGPISQFKCINHQLILITQYIKFSIHQAYKATQFSTQIINSHYIPTMHISTNMFCYRIRYACRISDRF